LRGLATTFTEREDAFHIGGRDPELRFAVIGVGAVSEFIGDNRCSRKRARLT